MTLSKDTKGPEDALVSLPMSMPLKDGDKDYKRASTNILIISHKNTSTLILTQRKLGEMKIQSKKILSTIENHFY